MPEDPVGEAAAPANGDAVGSTSAGTLNTDGTNGSASNGGEGYVPIARLNKIIQERDVAREETRLARDEVQRQQSAGNSTVTPENPPAGLTPQQEVAWYIRQGFQAEGPALIRDVLKKELGFEPKEAGGIISGLREHVQQAVVNRWETACKQNGLDPADKTLRSVAASYIQNTGKTPEDAARDMAGFAKRTQPTEAAKVADMLVSGLSGATAVEDVGTKKLTLEQAHSLAKQGKAIRQLSVDEILAGLGST